MYIISLVTDLLNYLLNIVLDKIPYVFIIRPDDKQMLSKILGYFIGILETGC